MYGTFCRLERVDECRITTTVLSYGARGERVEVIPMEIVGWHVSAGTDGDRELSILMRRGMVIVITEHSNSGVDAIAQSIDVIQRLWGAR